MVRFHMPGHKGKGMLGCEKWDITEVYGADALYEADGIIAKSERNAAELLASRERDRESLVVSEAALGQAVEHLDRPEVAAEDLRRASQALERLLGRMDAEAVLDRLFTAFCIGK